MLTKIIFLLMATLVSVTAFSAQPAQLPFKKVIVIVFENENQDQVIKNPYFKELASRGANLTNFSGEVHPSQGNYIALVAGDRYGVSSDRNVDLNVPHIGDLLEAKQKSWHVYAEGFPGNCFSGASYGKYARKHNPFISFTNISKNPERCKSITDAKNFFVDWKSGNLPDFSLYIPDSDNDGHDTNINYSANWLKKTFESSFQDPALMKDTLVVLTYDEDSGSSQNKIYTVLLGSTIAAGSTNSDSLNHYSILKLVEDTLQIGSLNRYDTKALPIQGVWK